MIHWNTKNVEKVQVNTSVVVNEKPSFLEKLNVVKEVKKESDEEIVKDGCVTISLVGRKIKYNYGKMTYVADDMKIPSHHYVMNNLVRLHEKRKNEYINQWGYEDYENTFLFKNYDYEYFDKLDEIHEREMEELELEMELSAEPESDFFGGDYDYY